MLKVHICVGSSCHLRGSDELAARLEALIAEQDLGADVELIGSFCLNECSMGVSVRVGDAIYGGVCPEDARAFFQEAILPCLRDEATDDAHPL